MSNLSVTFRSRTPPTLVPLVLPTVFSTPLCSLDIISPLGKVKFFRSSVWCISASALTALPHLIFSPRGVVSSSGGCVSGFLPRVWRHSTTCNHLLGSATALVSCFQPSTFSLVSAVFCSSRSASLLNVYHHLLFKKYFSGALSTASPSQCLGVVNSILSFDFRQTPLILRGVPPLRLLLGHATSVIIGHLL